MTNETAPFVHLHIHSEYSLADGAIRLSSLLKKVKKMGHTSVALTDHGNMFAAVDFFLKAKKEGIKPILGAEIYVSPSPHTEKILAELKPEDRPTGPFHLVLLAKNNLGYKNLLKIVSRGYTMGLGEVPVVPFQELCALGEGLFMLSSCQLGEVAYLTNLLSQDCRDPEEMRQKLKIGTSDPFAKALLALCASLQTASQGGFYIEVIDNNIAGQSRYLDFLTEVAQELNLPLVATADAHYLEEEDKETHTVLLALKNGLTLNTMRDRSVSARYHVLDNREFCELYARWPEAIANTLKIADACSVDIEMGKYYLPNYTLEGETSEESLRRLSLEGLELRNKEWEDIHQKKIPSEQRSQAIERLEFELDVIIKMGFPGYFLIVQDFINWAKNKGIPVGPGRGSGAGSLVAYALRITDLDPIAYNLIFERFLNPERVSMPDFDVDFCQDRRGEVIDYVTQKYGSANVAQIITFGELKTKAAIKSVGRALSIPYLKVDRFNKLIPNELNITIKDALAQEPKLSEVMRSDAEIEELMGFAQKIEGMKSHTSVHAAGVVIADKAMENYVPLYRTLDDPSLITQYEMKNAEKVGLVKFDFLGLKTLTVIDKAVKLIRGGKDPNFDLRMIPMEDKSVYDLISSGNTIGIFQIEGSGMQQLLLKLQPSCLDDVFAVVALFRPGPLGSGMVDDFIERKHGRQEIKYPHPLTEEILKETYGIILYQEQVQKIAKEMASYSLGEADLLRRAMGKKNPQEMAAQKSRFIDGCSANQIDATLAENIFDLMAKFAEYGFNKSHTAAYGVLSYQTAYLKTHFPHEFMAAIMTCDMDRQDKIVRYIAECERMGIKVHAPSLNESELDFTVAKNESALHFALAAIKGMGRAMLEPAIEERRANGKFTSITDFAERVNLGKVGKKNLETLIIAGAFDCFGVCRQDIFPWVNDLYDFSQKHHETKKQGMRTLFSLFSSEDADHNKYAFRHPWDELDFFKKPSNTLSWLIKEKDLLGRFVSQHPLENYSDEIRSFSGARFAEIQQITLKAREKKPFMVMGIMTQIQEKRTKSGKNLVVLNVEDLSGSLELAIFTEDIRSLNLPKLNTVMGFHIIAEGRFDNQGVRFKFDKAVDVASLYKEKVHKLHIKLSPRDKDKQQKNHDLVMKGIDKLKDLVLAYHGEVPWHLSYAMESAEVYISSAGIEKISLEEDFTQALKNLPGLDITLNYH